VTLCIIDCAACWIQYHMINLLREIWISLHLKIQCLPHSKYTTSSTSLICVAIHIVNVHKLQTHFMNLT